MRFDRRGFESFVLDDCAAPGAQFTNTNLERAAFDDVNLKDARFSNVNLSGASIDNANIEGLTIFGVDVAALIRTELDRRSNP